MYNISLVKIVTMNPPRIMNISNKNYNKKEQLLCLHFLNKQDFHFQIILRCGNSTVETVLNFHMALDLRFHV
jgi:hypothetical protein